MTDDFISEECIADRAKQIEYLGNMRIMNLVVEQVFNQREYGDDTISTRSRLWTRQVDQTKPTWLSTDVTVN